MTSTSKWVWRTSIWILNWGSKPRYARSSKQIFIRRNASDAVNIINVHQYFNQPIIMNFNHNEFWQTKQHPEAFEWETGDRAFLTRLLTFAASALPWCHVDKREEYWLHEHKRQSRAVPELVYRSCKLIPIQLKACSSCQCHLPKSRNPYIKWTAVQALR